MSPIHFLPPAYGMSLFSVTEAEVMQFVGTSCPAQALHPTEPQENSRRQERAAKTSPLHHRRAHGGGGGDAAMCPGRREGGRVSGHLTSLLSLCLSPSVKSRPEGARVSAGAGRASVAVETDWLGSGTRPYVSNPEIQKLQSYCNKSEDTESL